MIYLLLLVTLYIFSLSTSPTASSLFKTKAFWASVVITSILFAFVPSTQDGVGTDYNSYIEIYTDDYYLSRYVANGEVGTFFLFKILKFFSDSPRLLFVSYGMLTSLLFSTFLVSINSILKINRLYLVCFTFIIQSNLYHIQLSALRQALSVGFSSLFLLFIPLKIALPVKIFLAVSACITHNTGVVPVTLGLLIYFFIHHNQFLGNLLPLPSINLRFRRPTFANPFKSTVRLSILMTSLICVAASLILSELISISGSIIPILATQAWKYSNYYLSMSTDASSALRRTIYLPFILYFCYRPNQVIQQTFSDFSTTKLCYYFSLSTIGYLLTFASSINPALYRVSHMFVIFTIIPTCIALRFDSRNLFVLIPALAAFLLYLLKVYIGLETYGYTPFF